MAGFSQKLWNQLLGKNTKAGDTSEGACLQIFKIMKALKKESHEFSKCVTERLSVSTMGTKITWRLKIFNFIHNIIVCIYWKLV